MTLETSNSVKQGGSSSCKLFTAYVDPTIDAANRFGQDDWLGNTYYTTYGRHSGTCYITPGYGKEVIPVKTEGR